MKPATDIFISATQMVASIVVLPLIYGSQTLGGLYFMLETPSNFQNIKDMLMGFVNSIVLLLYQKLEGQLDQMWDLVVRQPAALAAAGAAGAGAGGGGTGVLAGGANGSSLLPGGGGVGGAGGQQQQGQQQQQAGGGAAAGAASAPIPGGGGAGDAAAAAGAAAGAGSFVLPTAPGGGATAGADGSALAAKKAFAKRSCTEAMLKVLQHEIRKTHARAQTIEWVDELSLTEAVGKGGFGMVYRGTWKGSVAAIKVRRRRERGVCGGVGVGAFGGRGGEGEEAQQDAAMGAYTPQSTQHQPTTFATTPQNQPQNQPTQPSQSSQP